MTNVNCADEQMQKWTRALRLEMGMPAGGSGADATRWFATSVPDAHLGARLGKLAIESRVDLVMTVFFSTEDREPTGFGVAFRTMSGATVGGCVPVALSKDEPITLYSPEAQCLYHLDDRGILSRRCGERVNGLQLAHKRAMKRLRRAVARIDLNEPGVKWQNLQDHEPTIPLSKIKSVFVQAA